MSNKLISEYNIFSLLIKLFYQLSNRRKRQVFLLFIVMVISGFAELFTVISLLPLLTSLVDPNRIFNIPFIKDYAVLLNISDPSKLTLPITIIFILAIIISSTVRAGGIWLNGRLSASIGSDIGVRAFRNSLYQPYEVHVNRNSSEVINASYTQVNRVVQVVNSFLQLLTAVVIATTLLSSLFVINFKLSLIMFFLFGISYLVLAKSLRKRFLRNSKNLVYANEKILRILQEGLNSIRDIIISEGQKFYINQYERTDRKNRIIVAQNQFLASSPKYLFETIALISLAFITIFLKSNVDQISSLIPIMGIIALGIQKFLPALQQIFASWSIVKSNSAPLKTVLDLIDQPFDLPPNNIKLTENFFDKGELEFKNVSYKYSSLEYCSLKNISLSIKAGEKIGIIGKTGSGKSTFVDVLMGLLKPSNGMLLVNGYDLHDKYNPQNLLNWRSHIAHVPQNISLIDDTFKKNIAFGIPEKNIDFLLVQKCARQAQISELIESKPNGYETFLGEKGINLSGGQLQRVGIARALYFQSSLIVLDEATSALDNGTEKKVIRAIFENNKSMTLLIIAHRLSTLENCDRIIEIHNGSIKDIDTAQKMLKK